MQRVLRWDVPVDDQWHDIGAGYVVNVASRHYYERPGDLVEVWTLEDTADTNPGDSLSIPMRSVTVVGTGHPVPENTEHVGSAVVATRVFRVASASADGFGVHENSTSSGSLVWHVFAKYDPEAERAALAEEGRRLASIREDLIAQGVDPTELPAPLFPDPLPPVGNRVSGIVRSAKVETLEDEATSLAYWLASELGEHVDDQDGETLTQTVQRLIAARIAPDDAPAVPIEDWTDFRVGDVVVQNPAAYPADTPQSSDDFLVRRPGGAS